MRFEFASLSVSGDVCSLSTYDLLINLSGTIRGINGSGHSFQMSDVACLWLAYELLGACLEACKQRTKVKFRDFYDEYEASVTPNSSGEFTLGLLVDEPEFKGSLVSSDLRAMIETLVESIRRDIPSLQECEAFQNLNAQMNSLLGELERFSP